jgi:hypothetical protein
MDFPVAPQLGALRLATLRDVPRIATVATAGFYYSSVFAWERRYHSQYPTDTFQSYAKMFADLILDPQYVVLVMEDTYDPAEGDKTAATIAPDREMPPVQRGDSVVVGVAAWGFELNSPRFGQFMPSTGPDDVSPSPSFDGGKGRDGSSHHIDMLDKGRFAAILRYATTEINQRMIR